MKGKILFIVGLLVIVAMVVYYNVGVEGQCNCLLINDYNLETETFTQQCEVDKKGPQRGEYDCYPNELLAVEMDGQWKYFAYNCVCLPRKNPVKFIPGGWPVTNAITPDPDAKAFQVFIKSRLLGTDMEKGGITAEVGVDKELKVSENVIVKGKLITLSAVGDEAFEEGS